MTRQPLVLQFRFAMLLAVLAVLSGACTASSRLLIRADPPSAAIKVDGTLVGHGAAAVNARGGQSVAVEITSPGYTPLVNHVQWDTLSVRNSIVDPGCITGNVIGGFFTLVHWFFIPACWAEERLYGVVLERSTESSSTTIPSK